MFDFFNFENEGRDFPFYNNNPHLSKSAWVMLFLSVFAGFIFMGLFDNEFIASVFFLFCYSDSCSLLSSMGYFSYFSKAETEGSRAGCSAFCRLYDLCINYELCFGLFSLDR